MKKQVVTLLTVFLISITPTLNQNGTPPYGKGMMFSQLNLTDEQLDKINSLRETHQKEMLELRYEMQKNRLEMRNIIIK